MRNLDADLFESVWAALTTAEGLSAWFGSQADIDLRPGGAAWTQSIVGTDYETYRSEGPGVSAFTLRHAVAPPRRIRGQ